MLIIRIKSYYQNKSEISVCLTYSKLAKTAYKSVGGLYSCCYTVKDVSLILGICTKTAFKLIHSNQFKYYKVGRYGRYLRVDKASFDAWLENYKKEG